MLKDYSDSDVETGVDCHLAVDSDSTSDLDSTDGIESDENYIAFEVWKDVYSSIALYDIILFQLCTLLL